MKTHLNQILFGCLLAAGTFSSWHATAQVAISTDGDAAQSSSILDVRSTTLGLLIPRMTTLQMNAIAGPALGLTIFNLDDKTMYNYNGTAWQKIGAGRSNLLTDNDSDTRVEVEKNANDNTIRFSTAGTEYFSMFMGRLSINGTGNSVFIGNGSGISENLADHQSTFVGYRSGRLTTIGNHNAAFGTYALSGNTTGNYNTANGGYALSNSTTGSSNTASGYFSLSQNLTGYSNVAIGAAALKNNLTGHNLVAVGDSAMFASTTQPAYGAVNTAVGSKALYSNTLGYGNTALGFESLKMNTFGIQNTAIGSGALSQNVSHNNTAIGSYSLTENTIGADNTACGESTLTNNASGNRNVAVGNQALYWNSTGNDNIAIGTLALRISDGTGRNIAIGSNALYNNYPGFSNIAIGTDALKTGEQGNESIAIGDSALANQSVPGTTANTSIGFKSMKYNTTGTGNTALGYMALGSSATGFDNTAIGTQALIGSQYSNSTTAIGYYAGAYANTQFGTFLGKYAQAVLSGLTNVTAVGFNTYVSASNSVRIGNTSVTSIGGYVGWTNFSDARFKKNVQENVPGLAFIRRLKPVTYTLDISALNESLAEKAAKNTGGSRVDAAAKESEEGVRQKENVTYTGFLAQDVEKVAKSLNYNFSGVDAPSTPEGYYGLRYSEFVVPLVKAIQEQQVLIESLQKQVEELRAQVAEKH